jgi:cytochrome P450
MSATAARVSGTSTDKGFIDVSDPALYQNDTWRPLFETLRREDPVHHVPESRFGPYWAVTRYDDITEVEFNDAVFSSANAMGGVNIDDDRFPKLENLIRMDRPEHTPYRRAVAPIVGPGSLANFTDLIRSRAEGVLDQLPVGEPFNWVEHVSVNLTTMMLATLFDFPFEERKKLTYWSDVSVTDVTAPNALVRSEEERWSKLQDMAERFRELFAERAKQPLKMDLVSLMAHNPDTHEMSEVRLIGMLQVLIAGGNDTTRNTMSGSVLALHENPDQYRLLQDDPGLVQTFVPETIRYQTPVIHMRRTPKQDIELAGKKIPRGDKVVMWYISGNVDESAIEEPYKFNIARKRPRRHLSFGAGIHRCVGDRLAELQLRVLWEEILRRRMTVEVVGEPKRVYSNFIRGILELPVRISRP